MLDEFAYGRSDAGSVEECGEVLDSIPSGNAFHSHLSNLGLTDSEIVALASIESFGVHRDPSQARWSDHPRFDNFYFKDLLASNSEVPHR